MDHKSTSTHSTPSLTKSSPTNSGNQHDDLRLNTLPGESDFTKKNGVQGKLEKCECSPDKYNPLFNTKAVRDPKADLHYLRMYERIIADPTPEADPKNNDLKLTIRNECIENENDMLAAYLPTTNLNLIRRNRMAFRQGHSGRTVALIQARLNRYGMSINDGDRIQISDIHSATFDEKTAAKVKVFQKNNNLNVTGCVDSPTLIALLKKTDPTSPVLKKITPRLDFRDSSHKKNAKTRHPISELEKYPALTDEFVERVIKMCSDHKDIWKVTPEDLLTCIGFETAKTYDPTIQNKIHATGLIQFLIPTAKVLGTTVDKLKKMSALEQLEYVEKYIERVRSHQESLQTGTVKPPLHFNTVTRLYLSIFMPDALRSTNGIVSADPRVINRNPALSPKGQPITVSQIATIQEKNLRYVKQRYSEQIDRIRKKIR